ncbi:MAG TPA: CHAT domain-containing protein [Candidatus Binatia bacterium]
MSAYSIVLEASRDERRIKVSVYERGGGIEGTLRPYEDAQVPWDQVENAASGIKELLNRANRRGKVSPEILQSLKKNGQLLSDLLIPTKASEKLHASTADSLILYIDDKLVHLPWELLYNGRDFLCRRFAMGRVVSTSQAPTALSKRPLKSPLKVLVIADPRQDLKASYREGVEIRDLLDGERNDFEVDFKSFPVDIAYVKKNLRDYDIVHYAGHADYDPQNPSDGGWLLTDGRLRASEISAMGGLQPMPFLVFSNACQTGQSGQWHIREGYEEQIFGLANAHLMAGVQHYIGTFWEILDEPSSYFAKEFYRLLAQGAPVGEAVRQARQSLIEAFGEETIVWASYMLYGDPTFGFAGAKDRSFAETNASRRVPALWSDAMRSHVASLPTAEPRSSRFLYGILGVVAITGGMAAYAYVSWNFSGRDNPAPAAPPTVTASLPGQTEEPMARLPERGSGLPLPAQGPAVSKGLESEKGAFTGQLSRGARQEEPRTVEAQAPPPQSRPQAATSGEANVQKPPEKATDIKPATQEWETASDGMPAGAAAKQPSQDLALSSKPPIPLVAEPLTLHMNIIGQRQEADGSYTEVLINEGSVLRSYDNFQVHLETNRPGYVYILIYDSKGQAGQLFPDPKIHQPGFVPGDLKVTVPAKDLWFWLDEQMGTETIYVLASEEPLSDIRGLLEKMEAAEDSQKKQLSREIQQQIQVIQRGVGGITKGRQVTYRLADGKSIQKVTDMVTGTGAVVRAISFHHR